MVWTSTAKITLKSNWQFTDPVDGEFFRLKHSGVPSGGLFAIAQAQFNDNSSIDIFGIRIFSVDEIPEVIQFKKPEFLSQRRIAVKRLPLPASLETQLRSVLRPALFSSPTNSSLQTNRNSWIVQIDATEITSQALSLQPIETKVNALAQQVAVIEPKLNNLNSQILNIAVSIQEIKGKITTTSQPLFSTNTPSQQSYISGTPQGIFGADLIGWYRADNAVSANGKISQWNDLSGNGNHALQANPVNQPSLVSTSFNGKPAIKFDNQDVWFSLPNMLNSSWGQASLFIVYNLKDTSQNWDAMRIGSSSDSYWGTYSYFGYVGYFGELRATRLEGLPANMSIPGQHFLEVVSGVGSNSYKIFRNTENLLVTDPNWGVTDNPFIGKGAGTRRMNGDIAEVFLVKRAATDSERAAAQQYVKNFWQLTSW